MFVPRIGRQLTQVGIKQPCHLFYSQCLLQPTRQFGFRRTVHNSAINEGIRQGTWNTAKRTLGFSVVASIGFGISAFARPKVLCEGMHSALTTMEGEVTQSNTAPPSGLPREKEPYDPVNSKEYPSPPQSSLSLFELSFGAVVGICSGVFVKKGAKAVAWFLGGMFVFLQYLGSKSLVKVDWASISSRFENSFYTRDVSGHSKPPNVLSLWRWLIDFLTADFQPRASFLAGFALGLRVG